jgi:hypothetical protein
MAEIKIKALAKYNGHSIKTNRAVDLSIKFPYEELPNYIKLIQLLNENVNVVVKLPDEKAKKLGVFMIKEIKIDGDGEGAVKFNSQLDFVEADIINTLAGCEMFKIAFDAEVAEEGTDDEDN